MTWSYAPGSTSSMDRIRLRLGDTSSAAPAEERLENEEIIDLLQTEGGYFQALAAAARALAAKLSRRATEKQVGSLRLVFEKRVDALLTLATLATTEATRAAVPYVGGISVSDRDAVEADTDRVTPAFAVGMLDNPGEA